jgi:hypothetical protein
VSLMSDKTGFCRGTTDCIDRDGIIHDGSETKGG